MNNHQKYKNSINMLSKYFDRSTPEEGELTSVAETLPLGVYRQGDGSSKVGIAFPGIFRGELPNLGSRSDEAQENYGRMFLAGQSMPRLKMVRREEMPPLDAVLDWLKSRAVAVAKKPKGNEDAAQENEKVAGMADQNHLARYLQMAGAEQPMPYPLDGGPANQFLNARMLNQMPQGMQSYMANSIAQRERSREMPQSQFGSPGGGSDMEMLMTYGPEDQVAFDNLGRPIPLADPRHPRNQQRSMPQGQEPPSVLPAYPQSRR